jgi:hypothetical protein
MKRTCVAFALVITACTTTPANLSNNPTALTIESTKSPQAFASCVADTMTGASLRTDGTGHYWVVRENAYGTIGRWDIFPTSTGSRAEWRRASNLTTGGGAGAKCA